MPGACAPGRFCVATIRTRWVSPRRSPGTVSPRAFGLNLTVAPGGATNNAGSASRQRLERQRRSKISDPDTSADTRAPLNVSVDWRHLPPQTAVTLTFSGAVTGQRRLQDVRCETLVDAATFLIDFVYRNGRVPAPQPLRTPVSQPVMETGTDAETEPETETGTGPRYPEPKAAGVTTNGSLSDSRSATFGSVGEKRRDKGATSGSTWGAAILATGLIGPKPEPRWGGHLAVSRGGRHLDLAVGVGFGRLGTFDAQQEPGTRLSLRGMDGQISGCLGTARSAPTASSDRVAVRTLSWRGGHLVAGPGPTGTRPHQGTASGLVCRCRAPGRCGHQHWPGAPGVAHRGAGAGHAPLSFTLAGASEMRSPGRRWCCVPACMFVFRMWPKQASIFLNFGPTVDTHICARNDRPYRRGLCRLLH